MRLRIIVAALVCGHLGSVDGSELGSRSSGEATQRQNHRDRPNLFVAASSDDELIVLRWDRQAVREAARNRRAILVEDFPLPGDRLVDLEIEPFQVTGPGTRFVVGRKGAADIALDFDPSSIAFFRGRVSNHAGSHVFLALSEGRSTGTIDLGGGAGRYSISSKGSDGSSLMPDDVSVFEATGAPSLPPGVELCGTEDHEEIDPESLASGQFALSAAREITPRRGLKHLELAVETDFELFGLFGDAEATAAYVTELYAQVSDIYMRDTNVRVELVFLRVWDDSDDLFNEASPLTPFRDYWNANMGHVDRDVAQLFSGRRNYPFGGQAFLNSLCSPRGFSVVGYAQGFFPDPSVPSPFNFDVSVTAHEIGHGAGTRHTHETPHFVDTCNVPTGSPQRGTIMSYCGQTWSGGNSIRDNYFHSSVATVIRAFVDTSAACVVADCNANSVDDALDIANGDSPDVNTNGIPDECEDCDDDGTRDDEEIALGSLDLNLNGIPDECEPDCNDNNIPDDKDIADLTSPDAYGNGIPDECEVDCDDDLTSDYTQIQANMALDIDRNAQLDVCQDCDGDETSDIDALNGSHFMWVTSGLAASDLRQFYASTGVLTSVSTEAVGRGQDLIITPDSRVLVSSADDHRIMEFDLDGNYVGDLVSPGAGGLILPAGLILSPGDTLLVSSKGTDSVLEYNVSDGTPLGAFVTAGSGGLNEPFGLTVGTNGNLFVTSYNAALEQSEIIEYDGANGSLVGVFGAVANETVRDQELGTANASYMDVVIWQSITAGFDGKLTHVQFAKTTAGATPGTLSVYDGEGVAGTLLSSEPIAPVGNSSFQPVALTTPVSLADGAVYTVSFEFAVPVSFRVDTRERYAGGVSNCGVGCDLAFRTFALPESGFFRGIAFKPDGHLLVASYPTNQTIQFDGQTGQSLGRWADGGTVDILNHNGPWGIRIGPNGNVFIGRTGEAFAINTGGTSHHHDEDENDFVDDDLGETVQGLHLSNAQVYEFDIATGMFLRSFISGNDHGLFFPTGFDFLPGWEIDCNLNQLPDSCDVDLQFSPDIDQSGVPDECEVDCNNNTVLDRLDIFPFGDSMDCNYDLVPDECNISSGSSNDCNQNGVPDECEADCNGNRLADDCDIGTISEDCNENSIPDECEADCNGNGLEDGCDIAADSDDCNSNGIPDECEADCNNNGVADSCDIDSGPSDDCNRNGVPDECEADCNGNLVQDTCDIEVQTSKDCNQNGVPDECDIGFRTSVDCDINLVPDECAPTFDFEIDAGWVVGGPDDAAIRGLWTRVDPIGTAAQPEDDHTPDSGIMCFVTGQGTLGGTLGEQDVDGTPTTLTSPTMDLIGLTDPALGYWRWLSNDTGNSRYEDIVEVSVSNDDGGSWIAVETVGPGLPAASGGWMYHQFRVADFVIPTAQVRLRFVTGDIFSGSIVEAAVDDVVITDLGCGGAFCEGDANGDKAVDPADVGYIQARFGCDTSASIDCKAADQNNDGAVDPADVGFVQARFGSICP